NIAINRINSDIYGLIGDIENQLADGEKENRQLRETFRQGYRDRLDQKLASRQPVNLRRFATTEGTSEPVAATFIPYSSDTIREEIGKTFQAARGRLLIVGQPGAGKTTLLLQLAARLFDLEADALPIVLNLATWQSRFGELETWLEAVLAAELSTNQAGARAVLRQSKLLLLLDGLDELKEDEAINSCLAAIANYGAVAGRRFVITCRMEEYKRVQEDARVNLQIEVGPLQGEQLEIELARMGREQPEAVPLLQAIQNDPLLRQAVETPFYFNTLQLLFAGRLPVFTATDLEGRKAEIKQKFVDNALQNIQNKGYLPQPATHWLSFLASRMDERNQETFEHRDMQYDTWKRWSRWNIFTANFIYGLVFGLVFGLVAGLVAGLLGGLVGGLVVGLFVGLGAGLFVGLNNEIV
ncbi:MAG: NACHT domain-containing protein, partial [Saprospiraceae bacterium]|nr:NACHT domain-containing protein [Saprospiraceae bacterium]